MNYSEKDIVKHYGIKANDGEWITNGDGIIFAVLCPRVAEVQLEILRSQYPDWINDNGFSVEEVK